MKYNPAINYIHRELEGEIRPFIERREVLAIVGPRQVGKTTLLEWLFSEIKESRKVVFLTFERKRDLALFDDIEDFREYYKSFDIVIIDEFQYANQGGKKLKYLFDTTRTKFIISGSSSLELTFEIGKYLVGRMLKFFLWPFSFREFLFTREENLSSLISFRLKDIFSDEFMPGKFFGEEINSRLKKYFEEYLIFGGYPAVVLAKAKKEKIKILESILASYLLKEIKALLDLKTSRELSRICEFLATQIGNLLNYKELSNVSGLSYNLVVNHINILKQTFIVDLIIPFFTNPRTELVKTPKVHFIDTGFRNYLLSDFTDFSKRQDRGALVENFAFCALQRRNTGKVNFWRTKSKAEVNFVLRGEGEIIPVEIKYSRTPTIGKSFYSFIEKFSPRRGYILTEDYCEIREIKGCKVFFVPVYYL